MLSEARKFHSGRKKLKHTINETVGTIADQTAVELARQHIMLANAQYTLERRTQKAGQWRKVNWHHWLMLWRHCTPTDTFPAMP